MSGRKYGLAYREYVPDQDEMHAAALLGGARRVHKGRALLGGARSRSRSRSKSQTRGMALLGGRAKSRSKSRTRGMALLGGRSRSRSKSRARGMTLLGGKPKSRSKSRTRTQKRVYKKKQAHIIPVQHQVPHEAVPETMIELLDLPKESQKKLIEVVETPEEIKEIMAEDIDGLDITPASKQELESIMDGSALLGGATYMGKIRSATGLAKHVGQLHHLLKRVGQQ